MLNMVDKVIRLLITAAMQELMSHSRKQKKTQNLGIKEYASD